MKDVSKILSNSQLAKWTKETAKPAWTNLSSTEKKKWTADFMKVQLTAWSHVEENAKEMVEAFGEVKLGMKSAVDAFEKLIEKKRKEPTQLSSTEERNIATGKKVIAQGLQKAEEIESEFDRNSPHVSFREEFMKVFLDEGAITARDVLAIKKLRSAGIDLSNVCGKQGMESKRLMEYVARWGILEKELAGLQNRIKGMSQDWASDLIKQINEYDSIFETVTLEIDKGIERVNGNITVGGALMDAMNPKRFIAGLKKSFASKDKKAIQAAKNIKALSAAMVMMASKLKSAKGTLKTLNIELKSLESQIKEAGELGKPFAQKLAPRRVKLDDLDNQLVQLAAVAEESQKLIRVALA
jgi:hypothetical protein